MRFASAGGLLAALAFCPPCDAQGGPVVGPHVAVAGQTQAEWSRVWWQWAGSFERDESPIGDRTGEHCHRKQSGAVWFLAGTYGSQRTVRRCTVPRGRYLFFPLINYIVMPHGKGTTCESVQNRARRMTDEPSALLLEIDGQRVLNLQRHRQASPGCFDMAAQAESALRVFPSASDGYYVMLAPLPPGEHVLNFGGLLPSAAQAITYTLTVE